MTDDLDLDELGRRLDSDEPGEWTIRACRKLLARARRCAELERERDEARALYREAEERLSREVSENAALRALADGMRNAWSVAFDYHCPETLAYDEARRRWAGEKK